MDVIDQSTNEGRSARIAGDQSAEAIRTDAVVGRLGAALDEMGRRRPARLAFDLATGKGEKEFRHELLHTLVAQGVDARAEVSIGGGWGPVDLRVEKSLVELKLMHLCTVSEFRFDDFSVVGYGRNRPVKDLRLLEAGIVDALLAVVPTFLDRPHEKYPTGGPHELDLGVDCVAVAQRWADSNGVSLRRSTRLSLAHDLVGRIEVAVLIFTRANETDEDDMELDVVACDMCGSGRHFHDVHVRLDPDYGSDDLYFCSEECENQWMELVCGDDDDA